ncbi:unnamed protein product [Parascedosporium putredinis]|uniref:Uncharacterized protein n=1 Tax=Parascedosporium putredinis TaxID=1442378 RepID=A0A9P1MAR7_9PEZI|nr:unnamed protein product [Parascedosporium putredinis]CAI7997332.1 unnamed protein product [Parascedosporium putredinis]
MAIASLLTSEWAPVALVGAVVAYYLVPYFVTFSNLRDIPAPFPAKFSNLWLLSVCRRGNRYEVVDKMHKKYGKVVRIAPNHISVADAGAINTIYGHGNGFLKSDFYDTFVSIRRGLFNTRNRAEHSRKRKLVSHTFAPKSVLEFEPYIKSNLELFVQQWDKIAATPNPDGTGHLDCLSWFNFLAFDIIADLAFGKSFGMLATGADLAEVKTRPDAPPIYAPAVEIMNRRGEVSATLGCLPGLKPYAKYLPDPFFSQGLQAVENLAGIAIARVSERLERGGSTDRKDLLARLMQGRDEKGEPLGRDELTAEALTQLIAGSDTTSNSSCALFYHVARNPAVFRKLRAEIDEVMSKDEEIPTYEAEIWGDNADDFVPERWETLTETQKNAFIPFSYGPRACVGRNLAEMQMRLIAATWVRRYDVLLRQDIMETREGFLRKPMGLEVGISRRALA